MKNLLKYSVIFNFFKMEPSKLINHFVGTPNEAAPILVGFLVGFFGLKFLSNVLFRICECFAVRSVSSLNNP